MQSEDQSNTTVYYEDMIDHRSYTHNLSSCEIKAYYKLTMWLAW